MMPESMVIRIQTKLAIVRAYGTATQTNLPAPILMIVVLLVEGVFVDGDGDGDGNGIDLEQRGLDVLSLSSSGLMDGLMS